MNKLIYHSRNHRPRRIIVVGPHPDDPEGSVGGAIAFFVAMGYEVWIVFLTKGEKGLTKGDDPEIRVKESVEACAILGVGKDRIIFGEFKDTCIPDSVETISFLEQIYLKDPDNLYAVFIPSVHEIHQDHRSTAFACITAFRNSQRIFCYESPSTTAEFKPTSFLDITDFIGKKRKALNCHKSQIKQNKIYLEYKAMLRLSSFRGRQIGVKYAEAFETIKNLIS